jgi:hypothetical protein
MGMNREYPFDRVESALRQCIGQLEGITIPDHEHHISAHHLEKIASTAKETRDHFSECLTNIMRTFYNLAVRYLLELHLFLFFDLVSIVSSAG